MNRWLTVIAMLLVAASPSLAAGILAPVQGDAADIQIANHVVKVTINNGFAITEVDQTFRNVGDRDMEAVYTFPLPRQASLSELSMWIDGVEVIGEVVEKERAKQVYEEERSQGRDAALAEQHEYHAFDIRVANVRTGSDTRVRIVYLQPVEIEAGIGRYVYPLEEGGVDGEAQAFWSLAPQVQGTFSFEAAIRSAYPLSAVRLSGGRDLDTLAQVTENDDGTWTVAVHDESGSAALDRDIVLYYRLDEDLPARVDLLAHRDGTEPGTFMVVVTPGADLKTIDEGVDWSIVFDVSGSMEGKIAMTSAAITEALGQLRPQDRFRLIAFDSHVQELVPDWRPVTPASIEDARLLLRGVETGGGTNVYAGFQRGIHRLEEDRTSAVLLISDGGANIGPTEHEDFIKLLGKRDVRVFTFVVGQGANLNLMERIARDSGGFSMSVSNRDDLYGRLMQAKDKLGREALHGVWLELDGVIERDMAPSRLPSAYYGEQIVLFGRYDDPGFKTLRLRARISGEEREWETRVELPALDERYPELERLWALARIRDLGETMKHEGERSELREAVVDLGVTYSIVTEHTSMIVVEKERFEDHGIDRTNERRTERERQARAARQASAPAQTRADEQAPMFVGRRAPSTGAGAIEPWGVAMLVLLLLTSVAIRRWM